MRAVVLLSCAVWLGACGTNGNDAPGVAAPAETKPRSTATANPSGVPGSSGCERTPVAPGVTDETLTSGGEERVFQLSIPEAYDGTTPFPVVLGLHSLTAAHLLAPIEASFGALAERDEFIGVTPSGRLDDGVPFWFAAPTRDNYDVAFIAAVLDEIEAELCVDRARVYATGVSNGAQMSSVLACRLPHRIAAVAAIAGVEFSDGCDDGPVPVMAFHGTADPVITYDGPGLNTTRIADMHYWKGDVPEGLPEQRGVDASMEAWARHNECDPEPVEEPVAVDVRRRTWQNCSAATVLYVVDGGGHGRPEVEPDGAGVDAAGLVAEFFFGP
jgi:polyhydroxybutyrate depolymerase